MKLRAWLMFEVTVKALWKSLIFLLLPLQFFSHCPGYENSFSRGFTVGFVTCPTNEYLTAQMCHTNKCNSLCNSRAETVAVKTQICAASWERVSSGWSAKVEWGFCRKCNEHGTIFFQKADVIPQSDLKWEKTGGSVWTHVCVFVPTEQAL